MAVDNRAKLIKILRANKDLLHGSDFSATQFLRLVDALLDSGVTVRDDAEKNEPLTLDELMAVSRDNPILVYTVCLDPETKEPDLEDGEWQIFDGYTFYSDETWDTIDSYGSMFIAYRHKPKEV